MLTSEDIDSILEVENAFLNKTMAETRATSVYGKEPLWFYLKDFPLEPITISIRGFDQWKDRCAIKFPDNLGDFVKDIAGNSLDIAVWILQEHLRIYHPSSEYDKYKSIIHHLYVLNALRITINNAREKTYKPEVEAFSENVEWERIHAYYRMEKDRFQTFWDISGEFRFKNFSKPKGKRLKKELLVGRCLFCHRKQDPKSFLCDIHFKNKNIDENGNKITPKHTLRERIKDAYKYLLKEEYTDKHSNLDVFIKSYELHTWVKWHPVHKNYIEHIQKIIREIITENKNTYFLDPFPSESAIFKLQNAYRSHPYINEFECSVELSQYNILEARHSIILESEHTIIKVAASSALRKKYNFTEESVITINKSIYQLI